MVKRLPAIQETWVWSLGWEDSLEKEMATQSSTFAWKIPWTEEPGRLQPMGSQKTSNNQTRLGNFTKWIMVATCHYSVIHMAQMIKHMSSMLETWVRSLGREDPLEKEMATHSTTLAWKIPWTEEPGGIQSTGSQRVGHDWPTLLYFYFSLYRLQNQERTLSPLQYATVNAKEKKKKCSVWKW